MSVNEFCDWLFKKENNDPSYKAYKKRLAAEQSGQGGVHPEDAYIARSQARLEAELDQQPGGHRCPTCGYCPTCGEDPRRRP